jgi:hypothetical protein
MEKRLLATGLLLLLTVLFAGCLGVESKEYRFNVKPDGSGTATVTFVNIVSQDNDNNDTTDEDFQELVDAYLNGTGLEDELPGAELTGKRLYEKDGQLIGELSFTFGSLDDLGFMRTAGCDCCPIVLYSDAFQEPYAESNGKYLGDTKSTPFVVWEPGTKEIYVKTSITSDMSGTHSLLSKWKEWSKAHSSGK